MRASAKFALLVGVSNGALAALNGHCPVFGPVLPQPVHPSTSQAVKDVLPQIKAYLDGRMADLAAAGVNNSALSVTFKSTHEEAPIYEYHYTPPALDPAGVQKIDENSVYRLASTSKLFPSLAILLLKKRGVSIEDPVTKYLPQLRKLNEEPSVKNAITTVDWDDITIGSLMSHLGGIPADMVTDLTNFPNVKPAAIGLPPPDQPVLPGCSGLLGERACTDDDFWNLFGLREPVFAPFTTPVYSNIGFGLLGFVVENVTGQSFEDFVKQEILTPLGLTHTFQHKPDDSLGVIPAGELFWNATLGFDDPAGSYYMSSHDLLAFGDAILGAKILSPVEVRKWLKPATSTSSLGTLIGRPWEIYRTNNVTKDGRLIEIYTKGGDIITYHASLALIPDYDIVFTILVSANNGNWLQETQAGVLKLLFPAIEQASKDEAVASYSGTYVDEATNSTITLRIDDEPGFNVTNFFVRGVDIVATYNDIQLLPGPTSDILVRVRLYPTDLATDSQRAWRGVFDAGTADEVAAEDSLFPWPQYDCITWGVPDRLVYQLKSTDLFVFDTEQAADGTVVATAVELPAYKVKLTKQ